MKKSFITAAAFTVSVALPASAEPAIGLGLSLSFGSGKVETGVGVRIFSDNRRDEMAATLGLDYMFQSQSFRPTVGAAYLGDSTYIGLDLGYDFSSSGVDFGMSAGGLNTAAPPVAQPATPVAQPAPLVGGGTPLEQPAPPVEGGIGNASDIRLKTDIREVGKLESGITLYQYRYKAVEGFDGTLDTETVFVGVMAQDLLKTHPAAVIVGNDGFYRVDYSRIGFAMTTLAKWRITNPESQSHRLVLATAA